MDNIIIFESQIKKHNVYKNTYSIFETFMVNHKESKELNMLCAQTIQKLQVIKSFNILDDFSFSYNNILL